VRQLRPLMRTLPPREDLIPTLASEQNSSERRKQGPQSPDELRKAREESPDRYNYPPLQARHIPAKRRPLATCAGRREGQNGLGRSNTAGRLPAEWVAEHFCRPSAARIGASATRAPCPARAPPSPHPDAAGQR